MSASAVQLVRPIRAKVAATRFMVCPF
jgi:hypothetical protein